MLNVTAVDDDPDKTVWSQVSPAALSPRTPFVVVCGVPLLFDHVMVSPTLIATERGKKKSLFIAADTAAGAGVVPPPPPPPPVVPEVGVTALEKAESPLVPTALVAVTVKV